MSKVIEKMIIYALLIGSLFGMSWAYSNMTPIHQHQLFWWLMVQSD
jgi:nitric oxide reductase large subunit